MRILVCGSRYWTEKEPIYTALQKYIPSEEITVITGGCGGADTVAYEIAVELKMKPEVYKAEWKKYGNAAGPIRNKRMLKEGKPDIVLAFPMKGKENRGTNGMINLAREAGVKVWVYGT